MPRSKPAKTPKNRAKTDHQAGVVEVVAGPPPAAERVYSADPVEAAEAELELAISTYKEANPGSTAATQALRAISQARAKLAEAREAAKASAKARRETPEARRRALEAAIAQAPDEELELAAVEWLRRRKWRIVVDDQGIPSFERVR